MKIFKSAIKTLLTVHSLPYFNDEDNGGSRQRNLKWIIGEKTFSGCLKLSSSQCFQLITVCVCVHVCVYTFLIWFSWLNFHTMFPHDDIFSHNVDNFSYIIWQPRLCNLIFLNLSFPVQHQSWRWLKPHF